MKVLLRSMVSVRAAEHLAVVELHRVRVLSRVGRSVFLFPVVTIILKFYFGLAFVCQSGTYR